MYQEQEFISDTESSQNEPKTGPIDGVKSWFNDWNDRRKSQPRIIHIPPKEEFEDSRSAIEKMRDKVAEFDEDYKSIGERFLGFFMQLVGYVGPFALVLWIGSDLGKIYA